MNNKVTATKELKYLWFKYSYEYPILDNLYYSTNPKYYNASGKRSTGGLMSLMLQGREKKTHIQQFNLIKKFTDDIINDAEFYDFIEEHLFHEHSKAYIMDYENKIRKYLYNRKKFNLKCKNLIKFIK
jgi:hypothetical protein